MVSHKGIFLGLPLFTSSFVLLGTSTLLWGQSP